MFYNYFRYYDSKTGRYVNSDPIDLQGGMNTYGYVGGSPLGYVDPRGLAKWKGSYREGSFGEVLTIKRMYFTLTSDCDPITNEQYTINVVATGWGFGIDKSLFGPFSIGGGSANFDDGSERPNPDAFNGNFAYAGGGSYIYGFGIVGLGNAIGKTTGWGLSSDAGVVEMLSGDSRVTGNPKVQECDCNE